MLLLPELSVAQDVSTDPTALAGVVVTLQMLLVLDYRLQLR